MVDLGKRLRDLRKKHNLTQQQVAERVWVSKAMISSYELSTRAPSYDVLVKLAKLFGVSTDYLFGLQSNKLINADGLSDKQIALLVELVEELGKNNY